MKPAGSAPPAFGFVRPDGTYIEGSRRDGHEPLAEAEVAARRFTVPESYWADHGFPHTSVLLRKGYARVQLERDGGQTFGTVEVYRLAETPRPAREALELWWLSHRCVEVLLEERATGATKRITPTRPALSGLRGLSYAVATCQAIPREDWPPLLFHGGARGQEKIAARAPRDDYEAIYTGYGPMQPVYYSKIADDVHYDGRDPRGWIYVFDTARFPEGTELRPGNEPEEIVIATCSGQLEPFAALDRAFFEGFGAKFTAGAMSSNGDESEKPELAGLLELMPSTPTAFGRRVLDQALHAGGTLGDYRKAVQAVYDKKYPCEYTLDQTSRMKDRREAPDRLTRAACGLPVAIKPPKAKRRKVYKD